MKKNLGIFGLLVAITVFTAILTPDSFLDAGNLQNLLQRTALYGIISIGVVFVIVTGGIDLSIGSVIGLVACILPMLLEVRYEPTGARLTVATVDADHRTLTVEGAAPPRAGDRLAPRDGAESSAATVRAVQSTGGRHTVEVMRTPRGIEPGTVVAVLEMRHLHVAAAVAIVLLLSMAIGLTHGLLIAKMRLQPFVVTLCGLLIYRGIARGITADATQGFGSLFEGFKQLAKGKLPIPLAEGFAVPVPFLVMIGLGVVAAVFLHQTIWGRYLLALGRNEQAARYSGIQTDRMVILAYVICSTTAGLGGILFALELNSIQPADFGSFYELYAIAAAVLGGCSLRGGEGSIFGVLVGAAVIQLLRNSIGLVGRLDQLEFAIIGGVLLIGVVVDELVKRLAARRRAGPPARPS